MSLAGLCYPTLQPERLFQTSTRGRRSLHTFPEWCVDREELCQSVRPSMRFEFGGHRRWAQHWLTARRGNPGRFPEISGHCRLGHAWLDSVSWTV